MKNDEEEMTMMRRMMVVLAGLVLLSASNVRAELCSADCNCDGQVNLTDLVQMKQEYFRNDCDPVCVPGVFGGVPKTGQTTSYATGDDGDLKKGVAWPNPRFTDNGNGTVTDNLTGLIWLKNANCFGQRDWFQAISDCNGLSNGSCGLTDGSVDGAWRLPNLNELISLVDRGRFIPPLPYGHPFTNVRSDPYWSSTTAADSDFYAWYVDMNLGDVFSVTNGIIHYVWPVRGGQ